MQNKIYSYKNLIVWQKSKRLVLLIYDLTRSFPKEEVFGLTIQIKKCSVSIPSNIAEGQRRGSKRDFRKFLLISFGSGAELETQLEIAKELNFGNPEKYLEIENLLEEIMKMLNKLITSLNVE